MSSFTSDDLGVMEPYADLPSMALAVVGFIIFIALVAQAYTAYQQKAFVAEHYQDAANLAEKLSKDSALLSSTRTDVIGAAEIEKISGNPEELFQKYGSYYNFMFKVETNQAGRAYSAVIKDPDVSESKIGVSASVPVTVKLNEVQEVPGTLTVRMWRK
ncbi:MAG TPA: hypothetical protein VIO58_15050 [Candidatus Methanoperedens sp.]